MIQLFVNGFELDVSEEIQIPISYYQADAKNPEKRKRSFSKDIILPGTQRNNSFFMSAYNLNISDVYGDLVGFDFDPTVRYPAELKKNGRTILKGAANLSKVITRSDVTNGRVNQFHLKIFSDITNWFQQLGDIKISELDWSAYDFTLSVANIVATWSAPVGSGIWYPYCQYGFSQDPLKIETNQLFPYVYVKEIVEKCAEYAGYSILGSFFSADPFNKLTWGRGGGEIITINTSDVADRLVQFTGSGSDTAVVAPAGINTVGIVFFTYFLYFKQYIFSDNADITIVQISDNLAQMNEDTGEVVIANTGSYNLTIASNLTVDYGSTVAPTSDQAYVIRTYLRIFVNEAKVAETIYNTTDTTPGSDTFNLNLTQPLNLSSGDIVQVSFYQSVTGTNFKFGNGETLTLDTTFNSIGYEMTATDSLIVDGDTVNISRFLPDMKAVDFMNDIITMFNLYISDPSNEGETILLPEGDYFNDTDEADIWTDKLDRGSNIEIMAATMIEGKTYKFKWARDRDYYKQLYFDTYGQDYGDYDYNVPSTFKKGEKVYQLNSAQSCPVQIEGTDIIIPHIYQRDEATGVVKPHKGKARFFFNNGVTATANGWNLINSDTLAASAQAVYPQAHHLDDIDAPTFDLNFGVPTVVFYNATAYSNENLFYAYHAQFIRQLVGRDSKIVNAWFKLNENDFYDNFMRTLVNIDGVVYRKNAVTDWIANEQGVVKVELLKILAGNSRNMQGLDNLPSPFEPMTGGTGDGVIHTGDTTTGSYQRTYLFDTSGGAINVYLTANTTPFLGAPVGTIYNIKLVTGGNPLTIHSPPPALGGSIEGAATLVINNEGDSAQIQLMDANGVYKII